MKKLKTFEDYTYRGENPEKLAAYSFINKVKKWMEYIVKDEEELLEVHKSTVYLNIVSKKGHLVFSCYYTKPRSNWDRKLTKVREIAYGQTSSEYRDGEWSFITKIDDLYTLQDYLDYEVSKHLPVSRIDANEQGFSVAKFNVSEVEKLNNIDISIDNYNLFKQNKNEE